MRLKTYINEVSILDMQDIVENIKKKSAPYFKKAGPNGDFLYRGVRTSSLSDKRSVIKIKPRTDRQPLDTDKSLHDFLDELFLEHKGWKARSEGVFVTARRASAGSYGKVFIMFPIGSFKFLYNPAVVDLTNHLSELGINHRADADPVAHRETLHSCDPENSFLIYETNKRNEKLLKVIKGYTNKNLITATDKDVEVMIKCKEYFLVDATNAPLLKELEKLF